MLPHESTYPFFEANQVLKKDDLNNLFEYLDEQNRMTRTNLIGIGIVCGMHVEPGINQLKITKGVGVTSEGYLVTVPEKAYTHCKQYPANKNIFLGDDCYSETFKKDKNTLHSYVEGILPNQLLELVEGTPASSTPINAVFLADKVVLIYVELSKNGLKNCSPNSCDDKGTEISVTFRRFLISKTNADIIKKEALDLVGLQSSIDIEKIINAKFLLPEIRLKRFDVPNSIPVFTGDIVKAYQKILTKIFIETTLKANLVKLFEAYETLLTGLDKTIIQNWNVPNDGSAVKLSKPYEYQYFYDFVSDLIQNYHEIMAQGLEVMALCSPDCRMFPRHIFLGEANIDTSKNKNNYRQYFIPSPIIGNQKKKGEQLRSLFERMIILIKFFKIPAPAKEAKDKLLDAKIRITPSKLGDIVLSKKAIPYYYDVNVGTPKLYETWNFNLKNQGKEKQNLSYDANLYANPTDEFVIKPLEYDLEPYNFLRIEGIVGKPYQEVMAAVNQYIEEQRLPFDIVALRTGNDTLNIEANLADFECHFADLETIYDVQREDLFCFIEELNKGINKEFNADGSPKVSIVFPIDIFPENLSLFTVETFSKIYESIIKSTTTNFELHHFILCKIEITANLVIDYHNRLEKLKAEFLFSNYTKKNAGIQHKAGVPMGGTFVIVYHGNIKNSNPKRSIINVAELFKIELERLSIEIDKKTVPTSAVGLPAVLERGENISQNTNNQLVTRIGWNSASKEVPEKYRKLIAQLEDLPENKRAEFLKDTEKKATDFNNVPQTEDIEVGIVFADFYLPYRCCADCTPVQVVPPAPPPLPLAVTISDAKCDEDKKKFTVTLTISGGKMPYSVDGTIITGKTHLEVLESGKNKEVVVKDADGKAVPAKIEAKNCEPCTLPCEGIAERCFYPLWIEKPLKGVKVKLNTEVPAIAVINIKDITGLSKSFAIDFKDDFTSIFSEINDTSYVQVVESLIKIINKKIAKEYGNDKTFILGYDNKNGLLSIEHYVCHIFNIEITWEYIINDIKFITQAKYDENVWSLLTQDKSALTIAPAPMRPIKGPKFGCFDLNKCPGKEDDKPRCTKENAIDRAKIKLNLNKGDEKYFYDFESEIVPDFVLWVFETENTQYSNNKKGTFISKFKKVNVKLIFIKGACFEIFTGVVPIQ